MCNRRHALALFLALGAGWAAQAPAQAQLSPLDDPVTVALPEGDASPLFSNNSAAAIDLESNIGIAYTVREEVDAQRLDIFAPGDPVLRYEAPLLSFTWRNTPAVTAQPPSLFVFTRFTEGEGEMPDLVSDVLAAEDSATKLSSSKFDLPFAESAVKLKLLEIDCIPFKISYVHKERVDIIEGVTLYAEIFQVPRFITVGGVYYIHCVDGRTLSAHPRLNEDFEFEVQVFSLSELAGKSAKDGEVPAAELPDIAGGQNNQGSFIAYVGEAQSGNETALITVVQQGPNFNVTDVMQLAQRPPSLFPGPTVAVCGYQDRDHYWVAFTDNQGKAVAARVDGDDIEFIELGDSQAPVDVACDGWGNAVVSWLGTNADFDYFIRTRVLDPGGAVIAEYDQPLPPEQFPQPQFAVVSNDINEAGEVVVAWSNGGFGVYFRRLKLDGHFAIDGTLSGSHFNPSFDGEGFIFDVVEVGGTPTLALYYFTYQPDGSGRMAWLVGSGPIQDNRAVAEMVTGSGAAFGEAFDAGDVTLKQAGTVTATFLSCELVLVEADSNRFGQQAYIAGRLTNRPLEVDGQCGQGPAGTAQVDASRGGSHFNPMRDGEGFIFDIVRVNGEPTLVVYFFTYREDGSGDPAWLVGQGPIEGDSATAEVVFGSGGVFGPDYDPADVSFTEWGTITVTWQTCEDVTVEYDGLWGEGSFNVGRLTPVMIGATGICAP